MTNPTHHALQAALAGGTRPTSQSRDRSSILWARGLWLVALLASPASVAAAAATGRITDPRQARADAR